ncbi:hypothetical protein [Oceanirhabdus sp. W0125-5]|uniref:hypothetical protein n=1 Tax=Oceanirhabdus sp. W0125-5 TaxID=2999116 RepID=UPI0022F2C9DF|nr:hypothetical protein [Oceanirhabdus sp. W0125-5]WBW99210.1 hypothetical protein OW730_10810 [Oceanirhabdus sp. W0125-5]
MKFFGPNKKDIWDQFSKEIKGEFNCEEMSVIKEFKSYKIELKTESGRNSPVYTIISCVIPNKHNLKFKIIGDYYERYIFNYTKLMDYIIKDDELKSKYIIRSNSSYIIEKLLGEPEIVNYLLKNRDLFIEYRTANIMDMMESENPSNFSILKLSILGTIMDNALLRDMFELSANIIDIIDTINSNQENPLVVNTPNIIDVIKSSAKNLYETSDKINSMANKFIHKNNIENQVKDDDNPKESIPSKNTKTYEKTVSETNPQKTIDINQITSINFTYSEEVKLDTSLDSLNMDNLSISTDDLQITTDDLIVPSISTEDSSSDN